MEELKKTKLKPNWFLLAMIPIYISMALIIEHTPELFGLAAEARSTQFIGGVFAISVFVVMIACRNHYWTEVEVSQNKAG